PAGLSASTFLARLWHLVNSPRICSIRWDSRVQGLLLDCSLFKQELLSLSETHGHCGYGAGLVLHTFRATQFCNFMWQPYRYGFYKVPGLVGSAAPGDAGAWLHYSNPCFRRDRPILLLCIKRQSAANRQRPAAGGSAGSPSCSSQQP
ncbi:HSF5 protein, partial [Pheucticus melanocephalus]|nr:HSF5 protein [Pheucticus melanocephalus]